jgi:hypothetical protein
MSKETVTRIKSQPTEWEEILPVIEQIREYYPKYTKSSKH